MAEQSLAEILTDSIAYAEREVVLCEQELRRDSNVNVYHRNLFGHIGGNVELDCCYCIKDDPSLHSLAERAQEIFRERAKEYDAVCRNYLDISAMIALFQESEDFCRRYVTRLRAGEIITGEMIANYMLLLLRISEEHKELNAIKNIDKDYFSSEARMKSVKQEMGVYHDYIAFCRSKLISS